jgi:hypothetical protein
VGALKTANLGLSFLLELAMLASAVYWGFAAHRGLVVRLLTGVGIPVLLVVFWALFMAPQAARRIPWPWDPRWPWGSSCWRQAACCSQAGRPSPRCWPASRC